MAIAFDAFTSSSGGTGDYSFNHTPVGTPRGAIAFAIVNGVSVAGVSGITYGGTAMTQAASSPIINTTGELGACHCFFLGTSIPTGLQSVAVDAILGTEVSCAGVITLTADQDTSVVDTSVLAQDSGADPSVTLSLGGISCFCAIGFWTGIGNLSMTPFANWNGRFEFDFGNQNAGIYTYDTIGTADVTAGYTAGSDDTALFAIAVREDAAAGGVTLLTRSIMGIGR